MFTCDRWVLRIQVIRDVMLCIWISVRPYIPSEHWETNPPIHCHIPGHLNHIQNHCGSHKSHIQCFVMRCKHSSFDCPSGTDNESMEVEGEGEEDGFPASGFFPSGATGRKNSYVQRTAIWRVPSWIHNCAVVWSSKKLQISAGDRSANFSRWRY